MAINVLLDNCVLIKLFSATEFSGYLKQIMAWHKSGEIVLYCPKALLGEWALPRCLDFFSTLIFEFSTTCFGWTSEPDVFIIRYSDLLLAIWAG